VRSALSAYRRIGAAGRKVLATGELSFWKLQAVGWVVLCVMLFSTRLPFPGPHQIPAVTLAILSIFLGSCTLHPICRSILRRSTRWVAYEMRAFVCSFLVAALWRVLWYIAILGVRHIDMRSIVTGTMQYTIVLFLWCNLYFGIKQWTDAREARLAALRYQLNPHFLFNSLNVVSTLIAESDGAAATRMLSQISEYLRATLDTTTQLEVPLSDEIALTDRYLAIEQTRLAGRLAIERQIDPAAWDAAVPSLLLQPLVENAVRHGIAPLVEGGTLGIRCHVREDRLCVTVHNSGRSKALSGRNGIGLVNTAERLRALYGPDHHFALAWPDLGGCEATVSIPFRKIPCVS
jgi:two-component system, LytTR family, sensor kinase